MVQIHYDLFFRWNPSTGLFSAYLQTLKSMVMWKVQIAVELSFRTKDFLRKLLESYENGEDLKPFKDELVDYHCTSSLMVA